MKRNILLLIIALVLAALAYMFMKGHDDRSSSFDTSKREFRIENVDDIAKIFIAPKGQASMTFVEKNGDWYIDDEYKASKNAMLGVLNFFKKNRIKFIPSKNATNNIIKEIGILGIKVETYDKNDQLLKSFYIGGNTPDERGTYFLMENGRQPYVLELPSEVSVLREKFARTFDEWRDYTILEMDSDDIKQLSVEYPKSKNHSFIISIEGGLNVKPFYKDAVNYFENPNNSLVDAYVREYELIQGEAVDNSHFMKDSVSTMIPFVNLTIETKSGKTKQIGLISFNDVHFAEDFAQPVTLDNMAKVERFYAVTDWGDFYIVQLRLIKKLLRSYAYFYPE